MSLMIDQQIQAIDTCLNEEKIKNVSIYNMKKCAWFFSKNNQFWLLSNMAGQMPIFYPRGKKWNSSEQLYQASKYFPGTACLPVDSGGKSAVEPDVRKRIEAATNARGAKMTQKCAAKAGLVRKDWDDPELEIRIHAMLWVVELKLYYNPSTFGRELAATGQREIVEISKKDDFWGCKEREDALVGSNVLGKLLMEVRERATEVKGGRFSYPSGFLLDY